MSDDTPTWARGKRVWTEDDCTLLDPSAERIGGAWLRLFGEPFPPYGSALAHFNGGDEFATLYPNGRVAWSTYCGHAISLDPRQELKAGYHVRPVEGGYAVFHNGVRRPTVYERRVDAVGDAEALAQQRRGCLLAKYRAGHLWNLGRDFLHLARGARLRPSAGFPMKLERLGPWQLCPGAQHCWLRTIEGGDPAKVADRRVFVEKTARVYDPSLGLPTSDSRAWVPGRKGEADEGDVPDRLSQMWADEFAVALGYEL